VFDSKRFGIKKITLIRLKRWGLIGGITAVVGFFFLGTDGIWKTIVRQKKVERMSARADSIGAYNKELRARKVAFDRGDKRVIEEEARQHGMIFPNEKRYIIKERKESEEGK
jgi:cell division protein FtsB